MAHRQALDWLLASDEPAVRYRARTWLAGRPESNASVRADHAASASGPIATTLLDFPPATVNPYRKWWGLHWRLVSLADFALPLDDPGVRARVDAAIERELRWIANPRHLASIPRLDGFYRADASMEGNGVYSASRFGRAGDDATRRLVAKLLEWQWPDGGWNCDRRASGYRSSFHESWATALGLAAFRDAVGPKDPLAREADAAARRTAELLLSHQLLRSLDGRRQMHPSMSQLHWPAYWHYDFLAGLRVLAAVDRQLLRDARAMPALDLLESLRSTDGTFTARRSWWRTRGGRTAPTDAVDWGRDEPSEVLTLHAAAVLAVAGR